MMKGRVLIIDDIIHVAEILGEMMNLNGFEVDLAQSADQGLTFLMEKNYDYILCDLAMPGKNGLTFAKEAREGAIKTPILMITGWIDPMNQEDFGYFQGILEKPFTMDDLMEKLKELEEKI